jgi:protein SCO1/2
MKKLMMGMMTAWLLCTGSAQAHEHPMGGPMAEAQSGSLFNLKDTWTTSGGKPFRLDELAGQPAVVAMIYTSCRDICPRVIEDMKRVERQLPPELAGKVRFAAFSFDTKRDTEARLRQYAKAHGINTPSWTLARAEPHAVRRLSVALGMKYKKLPGGDFEHDTLIVVLDKDGIIRHRRNSLEAGPEETVAALKKLAE